MKVETIIIIGELPEVCGACDFCCFGWCVAADEIAGEGKERPDYCPLQNQEVSNGTKE